MKKYTIEDLSRLRDLIGTLEKQNSEINETIKAIQEYDLKSILDSIIEMREQGIDIAEGTSLLPDQDKALPLVISDSNTAALTLSTSVDNVIPQIMLLPDFVQNQRLANMMSDCFKKFDDKNVKSNRVYEFFRDISGNGQDTLIMSGELYKENDTVKLYRNIDFHYCYYLDLFRDGGFLYDKQDKSWKVDARNLTSVVCNAKNISLDKFSSTGLESMIFWKDVTSVDTTAWSRSALHASRLTDVVFLPGVAKIGAASFQETNIKSVFIPDTMEDMGERAFPDLTTVYLSQNTRMLSSIYFSRMTERYNLVFTDYEESEEKEPERKGFLGRFFRK